MNDWTRREFLAAAALAVAQAEALARKPAAAQRRPGAKKSEPASIPASEKIVLGFIGVGGMGTGLINTFKTFPEVEIAAVCDVYEPHLHRAQSAAGGKPEAYGDFRRVLDRKDIDAVVVATPDHWHGIPTILACQAGKDVYCEKPLAHRIQEGRAMVRAAEKYKRVTQMGNLIHAGENYHRVVEIVRSGVLGKISQTRVWMAADRSRARSARRWLAAAGLRLRLLARPGTRSCVQPQPLHLQLALFLGLRRRHSHRFLLPFGRPRPLGDGRGSAPNHLGGRRTIRSGRQRRSARYPRRHLRISKGQPEVLDGLEPDRCQYAWPGKQGAGHHVSGDRRHAGRGLRLVPDHPRERPQDRSTARRPCPDRWAIIASG